LKLLCNTVRLIIYFIDIFISLIFRKKSKSLVLGHEDGIVRVYSLPQCGDISHVECLEVCIF